MSLVSLNIGSFAPGSLRDGRGITKRKFVEWEAHFASEAHGLSEVARLVTPLDTVPPAEKLWGGAQFYRHRIEMDTKKVFYWRER